MKGVVREAFVIPDKLLYLPPGVEIDVPEDRVAEFKRWMTFDESKDETPEEAPKKKTAKKSKK